MSKKKRSGRPGVSTSVRREEQIVRHLIDVFPKLAEDRGYRINSCILATRHGIEILRHFDIPAKPVAVRALAFNQPGWQEFETALHEERAPHYEGEAYSVGISGDGDSDGGWWDGHLIIQTPRFLVDLTLHQMSRPQHNIPLEPIYLDKPKDWDSGGLHIFGFDTGVTAFYKVMEEQDSYQHSGDWRNADPVLLTATAEVIQQRMSMDDNARYLPSIPMTHPWESQVHQFAERGGPGLEYRLEFDLPEDPDRERPIHCLLWRDDSGVLRGVLYYYEKDIPPLEKAGNVNVFVDPAHQRQGIGRRLVQEALSRWPIDLDSQRYTVGGARLVNGMGSDILSA